MKKIALTSLLSVFAVSGAYAANAIDGNPLYMPAKGHAYSVTAVETHTENTTPWTLGEEFGYGVTDKLAVNINTSASENDSFDYMSWDDLSVKATFRALDKGSLKLDVYGAYGLDSLNAAGFGFGFGGVWPDHRPFMDEDDTAYTWTAGVRGGYVASNWTIAGHVAFSYSNSESFNWGDKGMHYMTFGLDGQYVIDSNWNLVAGAEYVGVTNDKYAYDDMEGPDVKNAGTITGYFGVNYNIDATKYVGAYINGSMNHQGGTNNDEWDSDDGFGYGVKFGIQF